MPLLKRVKKELSWSGFVLLRETKRRLQFIRRALFKPPLPENPGNKVYIHIGCGDVASPEFINVDARPAPHVHYIRDATDLSVFGKGYADLIYACHVLEHIRHTELKKTLWEWRRILKPGGILRLSVPDFDKLVGIYRHCGQDIDSILGPLMGGQEHEYNVHYSVFTEGYLTRILREAGFTEVRPWDPKTAQHHNFRDWADSNIMRNGRSFPVSLNLEATFEKRPSLAASGRSSDEIARAADLSTGSPEGLGRYRLKSGAAESLPCSGQRNSKP
jgi:predicted SAM-dependent methyltransferase